MNKLGDKVGDFCSVPKKSFPQTRSGEIGARGYVRSMLFIFIFSLGITFGTSQTTEKSSRISGFVDFNAYYDTREFSVLTYNILAKLPKRFQYFSLTNYQSKGGSPDLNTFYAEHNLRWAIHEDRPIDLTLQYVMRQGTANDDYRLGLRWRLNDASKLAGLFKKLNFSYSINPMFIQFRRNSVIKYMTIVEHVYKINIAPKKLNNRVYIGGFVDQNFDYNDRGGLSFNWVTEHQLGVRLVDQLYMVLEYRINDYYPTDNYGLGYGLEYKMIF